MNSKSYFAGLLLGAATLANAAPAAHLTVDHSSATLIDAAAAQAVWKEQLPEKTSKRLIKLYPVGKWAFLSQVEGGFNQAKICVVTARAALVPRAGKSVVFTPSKMSTAFDALPGATQEQCQALAKAKLVEAIGSVVSSLVTSP
jgi:hypothetical protein